MSCLVHPNGHILHDVQFASFSPLLQGIGHVSWVLHGFSVASHHPNVGPFLLILAIHGLEIQSVSAHPMIETSTLAL